MIGRCMGVVVRVVRVGRRVVTVTILFVFVSCRIMSWSSRFVDLSDVSVCNDRNKRWIDK
jgi:hypothetical protein